MARAKRWTPGIAGGESADTTHVTVADGNGNVVSTTQTINGLFGACVAVPGTGLICNNYMFNFDPHPGHALSIQPGKRVFTSMAPMMAVRDGRLAYALGLPIVLLRTDFRAGGDALPGQKLATINLMLSQAAVAIVACPDPEERLIMRIERIGRRTIATHDLT